MDARAKLYLPDPRDKSDTVSVDSLRASLGIDVDEREDEQTSLVPNLVGLARALSFALSLIHCTPDVHMY
jgi:hypothetical protein